MNQYGGSSYQPQMSPSQLGVRPAAALSTAFLSQAFLWMFLGLLVTTGVGFWIASLSDAQLNEVAGIFIPLLIGQFVVAMVLSFAIRSMSATLGLLLFFVYSAITGVTVGFLLLSDPPSTVAAAGLSSAAVFGGAAIYGAVTKRDLTSMGAYVFMALIGLLVAMLVNLFLHSATFGYVISGVAVLIFTALTAYDIQRIQRGDIAAWAGTMEKGAVMGAFRLYLDFINLFFALLNIFGGGGRR